MPVSNNGDVTSGLATLTATGWDATEPAEGGAYGGLRLEARWSDVTGTALVKPGGGTVSVGSVPGAGLVSTTSYASSAALEAAFPAASNDGKFGLVNGVLFVSRSGSWQTTGDGGGAYEVADWTALQAVSSPTVGRTYTVLGSLVTGGATGTQWQWNGTFWRPAGRQMIYYTATQVDGVGGGSTNEQFLLSLLLPAGLLSGVREFGIRAQWMRPSGPNSTMTSRWRLGSAGNNTDALLSNVSAGTPAFFWGRQESRTFAVRTSTVLRAYQTSIANAQVSPDTGYSIDTAIAEITVPALTGALYLSGTIQQATADATVALRMAAFYVE